jgi:hypothetical protein
VIGEMLQIRRALRHQVGEFIIVKAQVHRHLLRARYLEWHRTCRPMSSRDALLTHNG